MKKNTKAKSQRKGVPFGTIILGNQLGAISAASSAALLSGPSQRLLLPGMAENSVELPPDKPAWFGAGGMAVHINDIHAFVVLFHLGLQPEILIAFGTGLS